VLVHPHRLGSGSIAFAVAGLLLALALTAPPTRGGAPDFPAEGSGHEAIPLATTSSDLPGWTNVSASFTGDPPFWPTVGMASAYDPTFNSTVLYGGLADPSPENVSTPRSPGPSNWTWLLVGGEMEWNRLNLTPTLPPALLNASMAWDPTSDRMILFGGQLASGAPYGGTWALNGTQWGTLTWVAVTPGAMGPAPAPDAAPLLSADTADHAVVLLSDSPASTTWTFGDDHWTNVTAGVGPPGRTGGALCDDPASSSLLLFGGASRTSPSVPLADTWSFHAGVWTQLHPSPSPPPARYARCAYDAADGYVLLADQGATFATWSFANGTWTNRTGDGPSPPDRTGFALAFDPINGFASLLGGGTSYSARGALADAWGWDVPVATGTTAPLVSPLAAWVVEAALGFVVALILLVAVLLAWPRRRRPADAPVADRARAPTPA
jgi:hypothetical protein